MSQPEPSQQALQSHHINTQTSRVIITITGMVLSRRRCPRGRHPTHHPVTEVSH